MLTNARTFVHTRSRGAKRKHNGKLQKKKDPHKKCRETYEQENLKINFFLRWVELEVVSTSSGSRSSSSSLDANFRHRAEICSLRFFRCSSLKTQGRENNHGNVSGTQAAMQEEAGMQARMYFFPFSNGEDNIQVDMIDECMVVEMSMLPFCSKVQSLRRTQIVHFFLKLKSC